MNLKNKRIIVTGAASGIGRAIALYLAACGASVAAADIQAPLATVEAIRSAGGEAAAIAADVTKADQVDAMVAQCIEELGGLDGLVNNAGIYSTIVPRPFEQIDLDEWRKLFEVNVFGLARCCQAVTPHMRANGGGRIVNIISGVPFKGIPFMLHYVASKGAVLGITRSLARELGPANILVNGVAPGSTLTRGTEALFYGPDGSYTEKAASLLSHIPLGRPGKPEEIASAVLFLVAPDSSYVNGHVLVVDGGWIAGYHREW
jgi:NAD(P)-dependent dehydrogenase (short-subunit alcohol dehydrogenase family)